jgi:hypothetical protein
VVTECRVCNLPHICWPNVGQLNACLPIVYQPNVCWPNVGQLNACLPIVYQPNVCWPNVGQLNACLPIVYQPNVCMCMSVGLKSVSQMSVTVKLLTATCIMTKYLLAKYV